MDEMINNRYLGEEKITKLMLKFSIPCILISSSEKAF